MRNLLSVCSLFVITFLTAACANPQKTPLHRDVAQSDDSATVGLCNILSPISKAGDNAVKIRPKSRLPVEFGIFTETIPINATENITIFWSSGRLRLSVGNPYSPDLAASESNFPTIKTHRDLKEVYASNLQLINSYKIEFSSASADKTMRYNIKCEILPISSSSICEKNSACLELK